MPTQRKMTKINIEETSGVDHPAHLHEGWIVKKSVDAEQVNKLFGSPDTTKEGATMGDLKKEAEDASKASNEDLAAELAKLKDENAKLKAEKEDAKKAADEDAEKSADKEKEAEKKDKPADLSKSADLPDHVREALAKQAAEAAELREEMAKARADYQKEVDARLDRDAIEKATNSWGNVGVDVTAVAPALRRVAVVDAELAKSVEGALKAASEQLAAAGVFKEVGTTGGKSGNAIDKLNELAKSMVENKIAADFSSAIAKAVEENPALYEAYKNEMAGK